MSRKTRKLMWSVPLVAAVAVIGALAAFMTLTPNEAEAQQMELPGMVQNLLVVAYTDGTPQEELEITWDPSIDGGPVTSYRVDMSADGTRWLPYVTDHLDSDLRIIHEGLGAEQTVHFRVFAFNNAGTGSGTSMYGTTSASHVPERPDNLTASMSAAGDDFGIDLDRDGDVNVPGQRVINNLDENDFRLDLQGDGFVKQIDVDGQTEEAGPVGAAVGANVDNTDRWDGAPQTVIQLTWEAPDDPPGAPVTSYKIEYSGEGDGDRWTLLETEAPCADDTGVTGAECLYQHVALRADTTNEYRVYANNSVGTGEVSDGATGKTAMSTAPNTISGVVIGLHPDGTDLHMTWTAPMDPHGAHVTHYLVQAKLGTDDGTSGGTNVVAAEDDDYENLHSGVSIDRPMASFETVVYNVGGDDLEDNAMIEITKNSAGRYILPPAGLTVDIRVTAINRINTAIDADEIPPTDGYTVASGVWYEINNIPVGHENAPKRPDSPTVKQDPDQHERRSGLDIFWEKAKFNADKEPADGVFGNQVQYILVISGTEQTMSTISGDTVLNHTNAVATGAAENPDEMDFDKPWFNHDMLPAERERVYVLYAMNTVVNLLTDDASIRSFPSEPKTGTTADPKKPGVPRNLVVSADGHTEIKVSWKRPETTEGVKACPAQVEALDAAAAVEDDGSECPPELMEGESVESVITGYKIEMSLTGTSNWRVLEANYDPGDADSDGLFDYSAVGLVPDTRYYFRVSAVNSRGIGEATNHKSDDTDDPGQPTPPGGMVAQADGATSLKICWYEQNVVDALSGDAALDEGLPVLGYKITYVMDDDSETTLVENTNSDATQYTDPTVFAPGSSRTYRVRAITLGGVGSTYAEATATTGPADAPSAPRNLRTGLVTDTEINLTWDVPATNGGSAITGWIVEKAYMGSFLDAMRENTDAFTDAQTWWDGLNCPNMVAAVMDDGTADDTNPFCAMHADLGDTEEEEVERVFKARYFIIDDAAARTYRNYNLPPETERMYRVAAVNGAGIGAWSNEITATTLAADTMLGNAMGLMAGDADDSDPGKIKLTWTAGANANIHWVAIVRMDANGDFDVDNSIWTQASAQDSHTVDMEGGDLIPGNYRAMVIAGMNDSTAGTTQWSIWQSTTFTYGQ